MPLFDKNNNQHDDFDMELESEIRKEVLPEVSDPDLNLETDDFEGYDDPLDDSLPQGELPGVYDDDDTFHEDSLKLDHPDTFMEEYEDPNPSFGTDVIDGEEVSYQKDAIDPRQKKDIPLPYTDLSEKDIPTGNPLSMSAEKVEELSKKYASFIRKNLK